MIEVRRIKRNEWQLLKQVRLLALADSPASFSSTLKRESRFTSETWQERAQASAEDGSSFCALALDEGQGVGIAIGLDDPDEATRRHLVSMWVAPDFRGRLRGTDLATSLVDAVVGWAKRSHATLLVAGVTANNERALAFYKKVGFETYTGARPNFSPTDACTHMIARQI